MAVRVFRYRPDDAFFDDGNRLCGYFDDCKSVYTPIDDSDVAAPPAAIACSDCDHFFSDESALHSHYDNCHRFFCSQCGKSKNFANEYLLNLHLQENHDPFFQLCKVEAKFKCFLATCPQKFKSTDDRRRHCLELHNFPANFHYFERKSVNQMKTETNCSKTRTPRQLFGTAKFCQKSKWPKNRDIDMKDLCIALPD
uniref:C2H2-type domain-containing protein n=1 Tax=Romanomermis culicivorax TaxID=13658 RepID=A0A915HWU4_ROMCU